VAKVVAEAGEAAEVEALLEAEAVRPRRLSEAVAEEPMAVAAPDARMSQRLSKQL
jgi:hypothetical protein